MRLFRRIESFILMIAVISLLLLIVIQIGNEKNLKVISTAQFDEIRKVSISDLKNFDKGIIVLELENKDLTNVEILVNGEKVNDFSKKDEIAIKVYNNDLIEIDGTKYVDAVKIKVVGISKNIEYPVLNTVINTSQSIEILSKVRLKWLE